MYLFVYCWRHWASVAVRGLSPGAESRGCSPMGAHGLLAAGAPLAAERGLWGARAQ